MNHVVSHTNRYVPLGPASDAHQDIRHGPREQAPNMMIHMKHVQMTDQVVVDVDFFQRMSFRIGLDINVPKAQKSCLIDSWPKSPAQFWAIDLESRAVFWQLPRSKCAGTFICLGACGHVRDDLVFQLERSAPLILESYPADRAKTWTIPVKDFYSVKYGSVEYAVPYDPDDSVVADQYNLFWMDRAYGKLLLATFEICFLDDA